MITPSFWSVEMGRVYSADEQTSYLAQVEDLEKSGFSRDEAIKKVGISQTAYYNWKRRLKGRTSQIQEGSNSYRDLYERAFSRNQELINLNTELSSRINQLESILGKMLIEKELSK